MATGTVVKAWKDGSFGHMAVSVAEADGAVEYVASTPLLDGQGNSKSAATLKAELTAACKAKRDAQLAATGSLAISGTVSL